MGLLPERRAMAAAAAAVVVSISSGAQRHEQAELVADALAAGVQGRLPGGYVTDANGRFRWLSDEEMAARAIPAEQSVAARRLLRGLGSLWEAAQPEKPAEARQACVVEPYEAPEVERLIQGLINVVDAARPVPLSSSSMINKDEVVSVLNDISLRLPDEIRAARWLLKQREDFLARTQREGDELIDLARARAGQMVQKSEVVKAAEIRARRIVEEAQSEARRLQLETEDYCDQRLASFESILKKTQKIVADGRTKLQGDPLSELKEAHVQEQEEIQGGPELYDQDELE